MKAFHTRMVMVLVALYSGTRARHRMTAHDSACLEVSALLRIDDPAERVSTARRRRHRGTSLMEPAWVDAGAVASSRDLCPGSLYSSARGESPPDGHVDSYPVKSPVEQDTRVSEAVGRTAHRAMSSFLFFQVARPNALRSRLHLQAARFREGCRPERTPPVDRNAVVCTLVAFGKVRAWRYRCLRVWDDLFVLRVEPLVSVRMDGQGATRRKDWARTGRFTSTVGDG